MPDACLRLVGRGPLQPLVEELVREWPGRVEWVGALTQRELAGALDETWALLLPSRSEGLPRVAMEAFQRGRAVIGGRAGGIPDIVEDGRNGLLVDPESPRQIAEAMVAILSDRSVAERLAAGARDDAARWVQDPGECVAHTAQLVEAALAD